MKKISFISSFILLISLCAVAQKNVVKIHALPFAWGEMRFGYERVLTPKLSLQFNYGGFFSNKIPSLLYRTSSVEIYNNTVPILNKLNGFSTSIDLRIYTKGDAPQRFYIAPYVKYNRYNITASASFEYAANPSEFIQLTSEQQAVGGFQTDGNYHYDATGTLDGTITQYGLGFSIGIQFIVAKIISIDLTFIGLGVEYNDVNADLTTNIDVDYQKWLPYVQSEVEDIPYIGNKVELEAEKDKIKMHAPIIAPTLRAGITVGIAF